SAGHTLAAAASSIGTAVAKLGRRERRSDLGHRLGEPGELPDIRLARRHAVSSDRLRLCASWTGRQYTDERGTQAPERLFIEPVWEPGGSSRVFRCEPADAAAGDLARGSAGWFCPVAIEAKRSAPGGKSNRPVDSASARESRNGDQSPV